MFSTGRRDVVTPGRGRGVVATVYVMLCYSVCGGFCPNVVCDAVFCDVLISTGRRDVVTPGRGRGVVATVYVMLC